MASHRIVVLVIQLEPDRAAADAGVPLRPLVPCDGEASAGEPGHLRIECGQTAGILDATRARPRRAVSIENPVLDIEIVVAVENTRPRHNETAVRERGNIAVGVDRGSSAGGVEVRGDQVTVGAKDTSSYVAAQVHA